jgi:hypothetical protein
VLDELAEDHLLVQVLGARDECAQLSRDPLAHGAVQRRSRRRSDRWVTEGAKFDEIVQDPYLLGRFMDDLMCRIAVDHILENHGYQHAVNQLIVTFFMIGRMSDGTFQLPIVM